MKKEKNVQVGKNVNTGKKGSTDRMIKAKKMRRQNMMLLALACGVTLITGCDFKNSKNDKNSESLVGKEGGTALEADTTEESGSLSGIGNAAGTEDTAGSDQGELGIYGDVIAKYQTAIASKYEPMEFEENGLSFFAGICSLTSVADVMGYSIEDLNGDGVDELIIGIKSTDEFYDNIVLDAYTNLGGNPYKLFESQERNRYYYCGVGMVFNEGSGSAFDSQVSLCTPDPELSYIDAISYDSVSNPENPWSRFMGDTWSIVDEEQANQIMYELRKNVKDLSLTEF